MPKISDSKRSRIISIRAQKSLSPYKGFKSYSISSKIRQEIIECIRESLTSFLSSDIEIIDNPNDIWRPDVFYQYARNGNRRINSGGSIYGVIKIISGNPNAKISSGSTSNSNLFSYYFIFVKVKSPLAKLLDLNIFLKIFKKTEDYLNMSSLNNFQDRLFFLKHNLIKDLISEIIADNKNEGTNIRYLIDLFQDIRSTTFEGKPFSTGLILTTGVNFGNNQFDIIKLNDEKLHGSLLGVIKPRFWYMVDGIKTFYISNFSSPISEIYKYKEQGFDYVSDMLLAGHLDLHHTLFRTMNGREISIINSKGLEFINQEYQWRLRDYQNLNKFLISKFNYISAFYNSLIKYILKASKADTSTIIWLPENLDTIDDFIVADKKHSISEAGIDIQDINNTSLIERIISSDGATVIDHDGKIRFFGCFANLNYSGDNTLNNQSNGLGGTGNSAAKILGKNGFCIKISQDGPIHLYYTENGVDKSLDI